MTSPLFSPRLSVRFRRLAPAVLLVTIAGAVCQAGAQAPDPARGATQGGSFDGILRALDLKPTMAPTPGFVRASRPATGSGDYIPVGRLHPERTDKVMTPAEVAATTASLDGTRVAQQRRAGVKPVAVPLKKANPVPEQPNSSLR